MNTGQQHSVVTFDHTHNVYEIKGCPGGTKTHVPFSILFKKAMDACGGTMIGNSKFKGEAPNVTVDYTVKLPVGADVLAKFQSILRGE